MDHRYWMEATPESRINVPEPQASRIRMNVSNLVDSSRLVTRAMMAESMNISSGGVTKKLSGKLSLKISDVREMMRFLERNGLDPSAAVQGAEGWESGLKVYAAGPASRESTEPQEQPETPRADASDAKVRTPPADPMTAYEFLRSYGSILSDDAAAFMSAVSSSFHQPAPARAWLDMASACVSASRKTSPRTPEEGAPQGP